MPILEPNPSGVTREPYPSELEYFKSNPHVGGMATEDNRVITNPFSGLNDVQNKAIILNESSRLYYRYDKRS